MGTVAFLRNYHIAKYLSKTFDSTEVITIKNISIPLKDSIKNDFAKVHRVLNFDYRNFGNLISSNTELRNKTNAKSNSLKVRIIRKLFDSFPLNTIIGEGGLLYIINGTIRGIKLVKRRKITHIYSSFRPIADHVIAYNLKRIFPRLNWTADFRDPPVSKSSSSGFFYEFQWWFIKKLLSRANTVTTVSDGVTEILDRVHPETKTLRNGIYNVFDIDEDKKYPKFTLSFTGSLYPRFQKPGILLKAIAELLKKNIISKDDFQLIYAGKDNGFWNDLVKKYSLQSISVVKGEVSLHDSISIQKKSRINLIFSWSDTDRKGILTGKLYEYLDTGNPIFTFINGDKDVEFETIFKNINTGFVFYNNDGEMIKRQIIRFFSQWKETGKLDFSYNKTEIEKYTWEYRTKELLDIIFDSDKKT